VGYWLKGNCMNILKPIRLRELKTQASFLLKDLHSQSDLSLQSANRLLQISDFSGKTENWLIQHAGSIQLKHAYSVIAYENGYKTWADLKHFVIENDCLYRPSGVAYVHQWFNNYQQAETYFKEHGGYLLMFWNDFVVCGKEYISSIGLGNYQEQWDKIGRNWAKPADNNAFQFLKETAKKNYLSQK
jgi:hypothetical protein